MAESDDETIEFEIEIVESSSSNSSGASSPIIKQTNEQFQLQLEEPNVIKALTNSLVDDKTTTDSNCAAQKSMVEQLKQMRVPNQQLIDQHQSLLQSIVEESGDFEVDSNELTSDNLSEKQLPDDKLEKVKSNSQCPPITEVNNKSISTCEGIVSPTECSQDKNQLKLQPVSTGINKVEIKLEKEVDELLTSSKHLELCSKAIPASDDIPTSEIVVNSSSDIEVSRDDLILSSSSSPSPTDLTLEVNEELKIKDSTIPEQPPEEFTSKLDDSTKSDCKLELMIDHLKLEEIHLNQPSEKVNQLQEQTKQKAEEVAGFLEIVPTSESSHLKLDDVSQVKIKTENVNKLKIKEIQKTDEKQDKLEVNNLSNTEQPKTLDDNTKVNSELNLTLANYEPKKVEGKLESVTLDVILQVAQQFALPAKAKLHQIQAAQRILQTKSHDEQPVDKLVALTVNSGKESEQIATQTTNEVTIKHDKQVNISISGEPDEWPQTEDFRPELETSCVVLSSADKANRRRQSLASSYAEDEDLEWEFDNEPAFERRQVEVKRNCNVRTHYELAEELGRGKFGTVYRCVELATGRKLAAKFVHMRRREDREDVEREVQIMSQLQHQRLLQLYDAFDEVDRSEMCLITELVEGGELFERIIDDDFELTEKKAAIFMRQICQGVEYMHSKDIVHLDMKPENILCVSKSGNRIKLIDFGLARHLTPEEPLRVMFGTPDFAAPEVLGYDVVTLATDMWSVGVICYVLLSGLSPFMGDNDMETMANVTRATYDFDDAAFDPISELAKDFISKLLIRDPNQRLKPGDCLRHAWLERGGHQLEASRRSSRRGSLAIIGVDLLSGSGNLDGEESGASIIDSPLIVSLDKRNLKKYVVRRKWHKTVHAIMALGRMGANLKLRH